MFYTALPGGMMTRSARTDFEERMDGYKAVTEAYEFTVGMYESGNPVGQSVYKPVAGDSYGTLACKTGETPLYWPSTTIPYGFKATAGSDVRSSDQTTQEKWLLQDRLTGYGYIQKWVGSDETGSPMDDLDALNYRTAKEWRNLNREVYLLNDDAD